LRTLILSAKAKTRPTWQT